MLEPSSVRIQHQNITANVDLTVAERALGQWKNLADRNPSQESADFDKSKPQFSTTALLAVTALSMLTSAYLTTLLFGA
jgi:hypothetical protein